MSTRCGQRVSTRCEIVRKGSTGYTPRREWSALRDRQLVARGIRVEIHLEIGLKKAIEWIGQRRADDPASGLADLVDEACRRFDLSPIQADFLYRHFTQG